GRLVPPGEADLVLGHGLLEIVDDVPAAVTALAESCAPGGAVSVLTTNRYGSVLQRAVSGRLADARQLLDDAASQLDGAGELLRRFDVAGLSAALTGAGLVVE